MPLLFILTAWPAPGTYISLGSMHNSDSVPQVHMREAIYFSIPSIYSPGSTRNLIPLPLPVYTPHGHVARCPTEFPVTNYHLVKLTRLQYYTIGHAKPSIRGFILLCNIKCPHVHFVRDNYSESARLLDYHVLVFHDIRRSRVYINLRLK